MIWCVDDDRTICDIEVYTLRQTGIPARGFSTATAMLEALQSETPDLIVLDIMMPETDGITVLKTLRADPVHKNIPIILATAKGTEMDKITGLDLGADDYLVKPFGVMEMVARVKAVLRRTQGTENNNAVTVGGITLREQQHEVTVDGERVALTHKEFIILSLFLHHPGMVFSREKLMNAAWGVDFVGESRTVDMHIKTLRQKLGARGGQIKTVIGVGYRLEENT